MARAVVLAATLLALIPAQPAAAGGGPTFCKTARDLVESYERIDETDPDESLADLQEAERAYGRLADKAPVRLRASFRRILAFFPTLEDASTGALDIDDRKQGQRFVDAAATAARAFDRVFDYLGNKCNVDID